MFDKKRKMPTAAEALKGRAEKMPVPPKHHVLDAPIEGPFPAGTEKAMFGLGCFWGAEKKFWQVPGVYTTAVGYAAGLTPNPTYREVCIGLTGHNEVVLVVFDPKKVSYDDAAQDVLGKPRPDAGHAAGERRRHAVSIGHLLLRRRAARGRGAHRATSTSARLTKAGYGKITTEILPAPEFYYAEDYHQQYLSKNPDGYCGLGGTGVACQTGVGV